MYIYVYINYISYSGDFWLVGSPHGERDQENNRFNFCSWYVTMQIFAVNFLNWRSDFGLQLKELKLWSLH